MTDWIILRCAGQSTLPLAKSLAEAGFEAWSPVEVRERRVPRSKKRETFTTPLISGLVFADAERTDELLALSHSPSLLFRVWDAEQRKMVTKGHPPFRVFGNGSIRPVRDRELDHLRLAERKVAPKSVAQTYSKGDKVRLAGAGFEGLTGTVATSRGKRTWVSFPGFPAPVEMPTYLLLPIDDAQQVQVNSVSSEQALLAKAA